MMIFLPSLLLGVLVLDSVNAFIPTATTPVATRISFQATSTTATSTITKDVVYDGPEWISIQDCLGFKTTTRSSSRDTYGKMTVVVGTREDSGDKIVGVVAEESNKKIGDAEAEAHTLVPLRGSNLQVYNQSTAKLPSNIKDQEAINTMIAALTGIECTLPRIQGVGGADPTNNENSIVSGKVRGKVVILGGSEYACFAAQGLATLGAQVSLVSTNKPSMKNDNVEVLPPAVGDDEIGFATHIGEFDSLLDTADDERPSKRFSSDSDDDEESGMMSRGTTLRLLQERHNCERYVSSMTKAQDIVNREGVFFGPGKVKDHVKQIQQQLDSKPATFRSIIPPPFFGKTVETLLNKGIVYKNNKDFLTSSSGNNLVLRGWSLKDFMETSTWPSDSSGGGTRMVRFGLPVLEEEEELDEDEFVQTTTETKFIERESWDREIRKEEQAREDRDLNNPFVEKIVGEQGMYDTIVKEKRDCVLFLSATFCRTCKQLNPRFTSLARQTMESHEDEEEDGILFAKADAGGDIGKDLSRLLNVDSVPAFLLFRNGRRFGPAMYISRIPSRKLSAAIELLESGTDWDAQAIQQAEEKRQ